MDNFELFKELAKARNNDYTFETGHVMATSFAEQELVNKAKTLEKNGYIKYSICDVRNDKKIIDTDTVVLKGKFTDKGIQEIKKNNIKIEELKSINE